MARNTCTPNLTITSYNCEYADKSRLEFLKSIFVDSNFLLVQEHGLYQTRLDWFDMLSPKGVSKHGVSAMDERVLLSGRPHGGVAILWHNDLNAKVTPIAIQSKRLCAVHV